ncbi:MAG: EAL domain-containing protein [Gammaproteobacteria bacterium]|nr:EAL domain-containing protein [Gammaproteobacteria bacterium]
MSNENLLRVLTVFDASEEAETLINSLRNAGHIVRDIRVEGDEDMHAALEDNPIDIIFAKLKMASFSAKQALEVLLRFGRDIPLIVITLPGKESAAVSVLQAGARDVVAEDQTERFKVIVKREIGDLRERRNHRRCEQMLRETEKRAKALIDSSRDAIAYVHDGMHIYANTAYLKMFGYEDIDDVMGMPIMDMVGSEDHPRLKEFLRGYAKGESMDTQLTVHGQHRDENKFKIKMEFSPASYEGESCTQIIIRDQASNKELEQKLSAMSQMDLLTGLYNRNFFIEHLDQYILRAVEGQTRGALIYISLDKYQEVRTEHGIGASDHLLTDVAGLLRDKLANIGMLARFEGPVFTLLVQNADTKQVEKIVAAILHLISEHFADIGGKSVQTTASIGLTLLNETTANSQECISRAEKGCLIAEKEGGNAFHLYNPAIEEMAVQEQANVWGSRIKQALKDNQFKIMFQPIVSLHGEPGAHYEVLLRMLDDNGNEVVPSEFIPAAEQAGLMHFVDRWVMVNCFVQLAKLHREGKKTRLFIKLANASICDPELLPWLRDRIQTLKLDADSLVFEISEDSALNYLKQAKELVAGLNELSCRTSLSGFGLEQNTYQSLKHLKVNYIKVHMKLIHGLAQNVEHQEKVKAIAEHANSQNIQTIAAFVEDANSLAVLWQCAVDFIQGFFLQQPNTEMNYDFEEGV